MTTILIIAVAVNVVLFLLTIYTEIKRAKTHRDKLLEIEGAGGAWKERRQNND